MLINSACLTDRTVLPIFVKDFPANALIGRRPKTIPMHKLVGALCASLLCGTVMAQHAQKTQPATPAAYANVDAVMNNFPDRRGESTADISNFIKTHFQNDSLRVRAVFDWVTAHIDYDVAGMNQAAPYKTTESALAYVMANRRGVCQGYATVFAQLCREMNITAQLVGGEAYVPAFNNSGAHAWVAAKVNGNWWLFDPTWGAGYVNQGHYVRERNYDEFHPDPASYATDHLPSDPLWQLLSGPLTYDAYYNWKEGNTIKPGNFHFRDSIAYWLQLSPTEQMRNQLARMSRYGHMKDNILGDFKDLQYNLGVAMHNEASDRYNMTVQLVKQADSLLNVYDHQRKQLLLQNAADRLKTAGEQNARIDYSQLQAGLESSFRKYFDYVQDRWSRTRG